MSHTNSISLLTLNLWNINPPLLPRMERLISFLHEHTPDIVALQEVSRLPDGKTQAEWIARKCGYANCYYSAAGRWNGREEGLALLFNCACQPPRVVKLPLVEGDMQRIIQLAECKPSPFLNDLLIANVHLAYHSSQRLGRLHQMEVILASIAQETARGSDRSVLCGDLNDISSSPAIRRLFDSKVPRFRDASAIGATAHSEDTFSTTNPFALPSLLPGRRIDYVAISDGYRLARYDVVLQETDGLLPASDHYGILVEIEEVEIN